MKNAYTLLLGSMLSLPALAQENKPVALSGDNEWHRRSPETAKAFAAFEPQNANTETRSYYKNHGSAEQTIDSTFKDKKLQKVEEFYHDAKIGLDSYRLTSRVQNGSPSFRFQETTEIARNGRLLYADKQFETKTETQVATLPHLEMTLAGKSINLNPPLKPKHSR